MSHNPCSNAGICQCQDCITQKHWPHCNVGSCHVGCSKGRPFDWPKPQEDDQ